MHKNKDIMLSAIQWPPMNVPTDNQSEGHCFQRGCFVFGVNLLKICASINGAFSLSFHTTFDSDCKHIYRIRFQFVLFIEHALFHDFLCDNFVIL